MLPLTRQDRYRALYQALHPSWQSSTAQYEARVQTYLEAQGPNLRVLDAGCGAGGVLERFSHRITLPVGLDADRASLVRHRNPWVHRIAGTLEHVPFPDATFDLVISSWVLEHLAAPGQVFVEIARVLKAHGHFVLLTPNAHNVVTRLNRLVPRLAQARLVQQLYGREEQDAFPVRYRANTIEQIEALARNVGLAQVHLETIKDPTYLAFMDGLFALSVLLEAYTPSRYAVHLMGDFVKRK